GSRALPPPEMPARRCWAERYPLAHGAGLASQDGELPDRIGLYAHRDNTRMALGDGAARSTLETSGLDVGEELLKFTYEGRVRLPGYDISTQVAAPGDGLTIDLDWEVLRDFDEEYTIFVQVINLATTDRYAASDEPPGTSMWRAGQGQITSHTLPVSEDAP